MLEDTLDCDEWLKRTIKTDAVLVAMSIFAGGVRAFADVAPQGTLFPYVVWGAVDSLDRAVVGGARIMEKPTYYIKVVGQKGYTDLRPVYAQIDKIVQGGGGVVGESGASFLHRWRRINSLRYYETFDNVNFFHLGGTYENFLSGV